MIILALGANLGDRLAMLQRARTALAAFFTIQLSSPIYETKARYLTEQPDFLNAILAGDTHLSPQELLAQLKQLEKELGRLPAERYGPRHIDLDIIYYHDQLVVDDNLVIPHPRHAERGFVLRPLADIAPLLINPQTGQTISEMLDELLDSDTLSLTHEQWS